MAKSVKTGSEALGRLVQRRREELGMSRRGLVDATGLSYPYVSQIETGYRMPSSSAARSLATALDLSIGVLFGGEAAPELEAGAAKSSRAVRSPSDDSVVDDVVAALERLAPEARLEALAQVQVRLMRGLMGAQRSDSA